MFSFDGLDVATGVSYGVTQGPSDLLWCPNLKIRIEQIEHDHTNQAVIHLPEGQARSFPRGYLKCLVHLYIPTMIGWSTCDRLHGKSSAKKLTNLNVILTLRCFNLGVPMEFRLRPWVMTTLGCDLENRMMEDKFLDHIHTIAISDNVIDRHQIISNVYHFIGQI